MNRRDLFRASLAGAVPLHNAAASNSAAASKNDTCLEPALETPIAGNLDVLVCGAGPAGVAAAISAARAGAHTRLIEVHGCLGGIWTAGLLCNIIDGAHKSGRNSGAKDRKSTASATTPRP